MDENVAKNNANKNITFQTFDMHSTRKKGGGFYWTHCCIYTFYLHFIYGPYAAILVFPFFITLTLTQAKMWTIWLFEYL